MHEELLDMFSRFRHDLLNDLQLVYGRVQLGRPSEQVLSTVDQTIERVRQAGRIFGLSEWELSCVLFKIWEDAQASGIRLVFVASGDFSGFTEVWPNWEEGLTSTWAYYKELAQDGEIVLEFKASEAIWLITFAAPHAPTTAAGLPEHLSFLPGQNITVSWDNKDHKLLLEIAKERDGA